MLLLIALAALWNGFRPDVTPPAPACEVTVQFFNTGNPAGEYGGADARYGVRLTTGLGYAVLPADGEGRVRFYVAESGPVQFEAVPLYLEWSYTRPDVPTQRYLAACGLNRVQVPFGT